MEFTFTRWGYRVTVTVDRHVVLSTVMGDPFGDDPEPETRRVLTVEVRPCP